jgi:hypothetical protein
MNSSRKLTFQLTPLLDLLLIVIFAQYLDVRASTQKEAIRQESVRSSMQFELDAALVQLQALRDRLATMEIDAERSAMKEAEVDRLIAQRDLIGDVVAQVFRADPAVVDQLVRLRQRGGGGPTAAELEQLQARWKSLMTGGADAMVEHLLTFGELRKRCDLWELYLRDDGQFQLTVGDRQAEFRADTPELFAERLFEAYKSLPQPKSMVLVLFSYGDARLKLLRAGQNGLPLALEQIRADLADRSRCEFATMGFRPTHRLE